MYTQQPFCCGNARSYFEMATDHNYLFMFDLQIHYLVYCCLFMLMEINKRITFKTFLNMFELIMLYDCHATKIEYVRRMSDMLR